MKFFWRLMQFVVEGENTQIGQFTLNFEHVDQSLHTRCHKIVLRFLTLRTYYRFKSLGTPFV